MKYSVILLVLCLFCSCKKEVNRYEHDILGEWILIRDYKLRDTADSSLPPPPPPLLPSLAGTAGFHFMDDGLFEDKRGYFKSLGRKPREDESGRTLYLGNRSKYAIESDILTIYDINSSSGYTMKIAGITKDTLTLISRDSLCMKFARLSPKIYKEPDFDQLVVSTSGCFGSCPVNNTMISADGNVFYYGMFYNTVNGFYNTNINRQKWKSIKESFQKCNLSALEESYASSGSDMHTTSVTFIKDGKIVKTIEDYGGVAPSQFIWAYHPVTYLYQKVNLKKADAFPVYADVSGIWKLSDRETECELKQSECFYLCCLLSKAPTSSVAFHGKYKLTTVSEAVASASTDGRYFGFTFVDGKKLILDLGFNFIEANKLQERFKEKTD